MTSAHRTRIKICGVQDVETALHAAQLGVDAIGLVFYERSPRHVELAQAAAIVKAMPAYVSVVALLVDAETEFVQQLLSQVHVDMLQFHGNETPEACERYQRPYVKAIPMGTVMSSGSTPEAGDPESHAWINYCQQYPAARGYLLDSHAAGEMGGSGQTFDWAELQQQRVHSPEHVNHWLERVVLAGGLRADNVAAAIEQVRPGAVDISSGVESAPGVKDWQKMADFVSAVNAADAKLESATK